MENNMINTQELIDKPVTQNTISLSAIKPESRINIDATNGLTGVANNTEEVSLMEQPTIKGNPYRNKSTSTDADGKRIRNIQSLRQINPADRIKQPEPKRTETIQDRAMGLLAQAVERKKEEYQEFVAHALEADKVNRERVENGLETVEGELQYMPDELHVPITEEEKVVPLVDEEAEFFDNSDQSSVEIQSEDDFDEEDIESDSDSDEFAPIEIPNIVFDNPFIESDITEDEEEITKVIDVPAEKVIEESEPVQEKEEEAPLIKEDEVVIPPMVHNEPEEVEEEFTTESINVTSSVLNAPIVDTSNEDFEIDEQDLDEDVPAVYEEDDANLSTEEILKISEISEKHLKSEILHKIVQSGRSMDTKQFIVSNKVINLKDAMKGVNNGKPVERTAVWPLTYAGRPYKASALRGPEIAMLADADNSEARNGVGLTMDQARILFEHDANPYRPKTVESWAKTIPFSDIENIFAAVYVASLRGSNYIPMACPKNSCQHAYLSENVDIEKMIKFESDESKERFNKIKSLEITPENTGSYESVVNILNDKFAVGIKIPSIFTILYEYNVLNQEFVKKYSSIISIIQYIDYIYYIDEETSQFQPIGWKTYPGDNGKSFKSKVATYAKILKELDDTDFTVLMALINSMITKIVETRGLSYQIPSEKCPKCGTTIEERSISARGLVFMRQRLVELATTPSKK